MAEEKTSGRRGAVAPLSLAHLRRAAQSRHRQQCPAVRLGASRARPRRPAVHRPARPLRPDPGGGRPGQPGLQGGRDGALRVGDPGRRQGARAARGHAQPGVADRRGRGVRRRDRGADRRPRSCRFPCSASRTTRKTCGCSIASSICAARRCTTTSCCATRSSPRSGGACARAGFFEFQTPILTASSPGGRARLPGAVAHASRQVLRPAAGAAAVQAADHDRGLRPLLPDRALLPRRGRARRPFARRILPARPRDELRRAGGRVRGRRARHARRCSRSFPAASR